MSSKKIGCQVLWGSDSKEDECSKTVQDDSWAQVFEGESCGVTFRAVAGNKENFLSGEVEKDSKKISQLQLKKKYK